MVPRQASEALHLTFNQTRRSAIGTNKTESGAFSFGELASAIKDLAAATNAELRIEPDLVGNDDRIAGNLSQFYRTFGTLLARTAGCTAGEQLTIGVNREGSSAIVTIAGPACQPHKSFSQCLLNTGLPRPPSALGGSTAGAEQICEEISVICGGNKGPSIELKLPLKSKVRDGSCNLENSPRMVSSKSIAKPYRVLVAEDHPLNLKLLLALLQAAGCETQSAENGLEALEKVDRGEFDLIVMDSQMPVMTGLEAIETIRGRSDWKRLIPILSLTANAMKGAEEIHTSAGADLYMSKPLRSDCFIGAVNDLAYRGNALRSRFGQS